MSNKEVSYFSNVIWDLNESEEMHLILAQSKIDKKTAESLEGAMKVVYKNGVAKEIIYIEEGEYEEPDEVRFQTEPIKFVDYPENIYKTIIIDPDGKQIIGGEIPNDFEIPKSKCKAPFIYLGSLNSQIEESLRWIELNLFHLICPIHADMEIIYIDYTNPNKPEIINLEEVNKLSTPFDDLNSDDKITFKATNCSFKKMKLDHIYESQIVGNIGSPLWVQNELIPRCPKTSKPMKFLVSLESNTFIETSNSTVKISDKSMERYINSFNFWGDGVLFVFYSPESKIAAYYIQNT
jgi:hypothetical protein